MHLRLAVFFGSAVIVALGGAPRQAGGEPASAVRERPETIGTVSRYAGPTSPLDGRVSLLSSSDLSELFVAQDTVTPPAAQDTGRVRSAGAGPGGSSGGDPPAAGDSLRVPPETRRLYLGLKPLAFPFPIDLGAGLPDPARQRPELRLGGRSWAALWGEAVNEELLAQKRDLWLSSRPIALGAPKERERLRADVPGTPTPEEPAAEPAEVAAAPQDTIGAAAPSRPQEEEGFLPDVLGQYADLGATVQGRVELGGGWNRFRPCNLTVQLNCDPSLIPTLKPDIQFGARLGGTISERVHVNVDYDNRREFDAANNINVFYQGLDDEIVQRLEVGDVTFPLPQNRFLTQGIPAGNFGFRSTGQMGPIDFQTVWAQQKGDLGTRELQVGGGGQGFEQSAITILDDADYERGRFFFLFDPERLPNHPDIDIQRLIASDAPQDVRPGSAVKVYRYEVLGTGIGAQVPEGFIKAVAVAIDTIQTQAGADSVIADTLTGLYRPLVDGEDYLLHQSGLWLQLRNTLPDQEALAVTYIAADGREIGTFAAESVSDAHSADPANVAPPFLELIKGINHRPQTATWDREMHHVYRVSASPGVAEASVELIISQGDPEVGNTFRDAPNGTQLEFLKIFGLDDDPTDNRIDVSQIYEATPVGVAVTSGPTGTYIVPPTLEPFKVPPPLRGVTGLSGQPFPLVAGDRNEAIYDEPNDQVRRGSNLYLLTIRYRQRFEGFLSTISIGVGGVREGSDRVSIDGVELVRGEDYIIDYDVGQIELREPERWFANNLNARVRVSYEQKPLFQLAPTTVFGFQARYGLGTTGELNFIGLSQTEKTLQTRPELGLEPSAVRLGGVSGRFNFRPDWLTGLVNALPGVESDAPSAISLDGELALSMPTTNTRGITYVDDFEGGSGFTLPMVARAWRLGASPSTTTGAESVAPADFSAGNAAELVWQDQYVVQTAEGQQVVGGLFPGQIDEELLIQGQARPEPVLTLTARLPANRQIGPNPNPPPGPAWSSMTSVISVNGQDFTTIEFLEFYVAVSDELADSTSLILDLGTLSEDAFALNDQGQPLGLGQLNREVDPPRVWSNAEDVGLWDIGCEAQPGLTAYPLGSINANCTRNNGLEDTEDLNQNSILDTDERFFRYTIRIGDRTGRYFVRDAREFGGARFRLFRIPLRRPDHRERVADAEFQNIRHLRMTLVTQSNNTLLLARARFLGSRWLKRGRAGVVAGLADTASAVSPSALVEVGPISTLDSRYVPPPGISDQIANQSDQFTVGGTAFNEQSLSVQFSELGPGERAEVYLQYAQTPRDFLAYRSLRLWALGIEGDWGTSGEPLRFLMKLGEDARNFYLFQTPLGAVPSGTGGAELREAWLPELQIDFERFIGLRTAAEEIMLRQGGLPPDSVLMLWDVDVFENGDSSYAVVISQRSRAPNLAAVRQLSLGVYNAGLTPVPSGEVWVDDMRLGTPIDNTGFVGRVNLDVRASDLLSVNLSYGGENPYFRQLAQDPSFRSSRSFQAGGNLQFGKLLPDAWAVNLPVTLSYTSSSSNPLLLPRTDIQVERLTGLRTPDNRNLRLGLALNKRPQARTPGVGFLVDKSSLRFTYDRRTSQTSRSNSLAQTYSLVYNYTSDVGDISIPLFPEFLHKALFFLPERLRLTPRSIQLGSSYVDTEAETRRFSEIIELPQDSAVAPIRTLDERIQANTTVNFEPVEALTGRMTFTHGRERVPAAALVQGVAAQRLINQRRTYLFGLDLGWETARSLDFNWTYRPTVATWLTPQATLDTRFRLGQGASFITVQDGDTVLTRDFENSRTLRLSTGFNLPTLVRSTVGQNRTGVVGALVGFIDWLDIVTASWTGSLGSRFQRRQASPGLGYQFGFGSFDKFRFQAGDTASRVIDTEVVTFSTGLRLPIRANLNFDYSQNDAFAWSPITQTRSRNTTWPNVSFSWNRIPLPSFVQRWVRNLGFRTGYTLVTRRNQTLGTDQTRESESRTIPISVSLALATNWSINYNLSLSEEERRDPTGLSLGEGERHGVEIRGQVRPLTRQGTWSNPIRISLGLSQDDSQQCRRLGAAAAEAGGEEVAARCEPYTDRRIRNIDLTVSTDVRPFSLGLQGSWRDTQSRLGQRAGSTQLEISLFGQFLFETGEIR